MPYGFKVVLVALFGLITWPFSVPSLVMYRVFGSETLFDFSAKFLSLMPGKIGQYLRTSFYVVTLEHCPADLAMAFGSFFSHATANVGRSVVIGSFSIVGTAKLGDGVQIGSHASILSGKHQHGSALHGLSESHEVHYERVSVGNGCWIGEGAILMASVGERCIVGAGSVVTKACADNVVLAGNPAKVVRNTEKTYDKLSVS